MSLSRLFYILQAKISCFVNAGSLEISPDFLGRKRGAFYAPVCLIDKKDDTNLPLFVGYF
jgi:hypothetical protein